MDSPWILILETECGGEASHADASSASSAKHSDASLPGEDLIRPSTINAWKNHSTTAYLQCDIALFPDDLTLSSEAFLASVWRLPRQGLNPCQRENLLLFPPMNVSEYRITLSSCHMEATPAFSDTLPVAATLPVDARVVWPSAASESVVTRVQVTMDLTQARQAFYRQTESKALLSKFEVGLDGLSMDNFNFGNETEVLALLASLKSKVEGDIRAIDNVLTVLMVSSFLLIACLIKLVFLDSPPPPRKGQRLTEARVSTPQARPPKSPWLAAGVGRGTLFFRPPSSPLTSLWRGEPAAVTSTGSKVSTAPTAMTEEKSSNNKSPCHDLENEWKQSREERRRNRTAGRKLPRRLVPPSEDLPSDKHDEPPPPPAKKTPALAPITNATTLPANHKPALMAPTPRTNAPKIKQAAPEQVARNLWGFGM